MARAAGAAALLLATSAAGAQAGDPVSSFRLPPGPTATPSPAQGPVDPEAPAPRPPRPAPGPDASPVASPAASPSPSTPALPDAAVATPRATPLARPAPPPGQIATPTPARELPASPVASEPAPIPAASPIAPAETPLSPRADPPRDWPWWLPTALLLAVLGIAALAFLWRRREDDDEDARASAPPAPAKPAAPPPAPPPPAPEPPEGLALALRLEPVELRLSPAEARLAYRLLVTNRGKATVGPLVLAGDMIAAHAAHAVAVQLRPDSGELPTRHLLDALLPGETATLAGELPLPMAQVLPVPIGEAPRLVPLARWMAIDEGLGPTGPARVFALGQPGADAGAPMIAFRLDRGPARHARVAAREIDAAPWLSLDGVGAGG